jgi:septum formation protein
MHYILALSAVLCLSRGILGKMRFVLGSGSASRKAILSQAGYSFEVIKADIDESVIGDRSSASKAAELVLLLANAKADAILRKLPDSLKGEILLTADQVSVSEAFKKKNVRI